MRSPELADAGIYRISASSAYQSVSHRNATSPDNISVQTYKASCPPVALTKLPVIAGAETAEFLVKRMAETLEAL